jgi:hypothetical protein
MLTLSLVSVLILVTAAFGAYDPKRVILLAVFLAPWHGLDVDIGVRVTAYQCALLACLLGMGIRLCLGYLTTSNRSVGFWILAYVFWTVGVSLVQIPLLREASVEGGAFRAPIVRAIIQIPVFLLAMSPVILVPLVLKLRSDIFEVGKVYLISCVVLAIIGWFQLAVWISTGNNPLPIGYVNELLGGMGPTYEGITSIGDELTFRMNSLGGEPKYLGVSLVISVVLLQQQLYYLTDGNVRLIGLWLFLLIAAYATLSTSAIYLWVIASLLQALLILQKAERGSPARARPIASAVLLLVGLLAAVVIAFESIIEDDQMLLLAVLYARTLGRSDDSVIIEDFDEAILTLLWENPLLAIVGVGLGNVHLFANEYLAPLFAEYARDTAFTAKAGYLRLVSECGIIGLVLFCLAIVENARKLLRRSKYLTLAPDQIWNVNVAHLTIVVGVGYLATSLIAGQTVFAIATCAAAFRIHAIEARRNATSKVGRYAPGIAATSLRARS